MDTFKYTLDAIVPILLIIVAGYIIRRIGPWNGGFYKELNSLCFHFFLPIQIFINVYSVENLADINWRFLAFLMSSVIFCLFFGFLVTLRFPKENERRAVIIQDCFRSNQAILGLPLANALGGEPAMAFASLVTSLCVPLYNTLGVIVLTIGGRAGKASLSLRDLSRRVITNPLVIGGLSGFLIVIVRQFVPKVDGEPVFMIKNQLYLLYEAMNKVSVIASPMMLFVLGARFEFGAVKKLLKLIVFGSILRLVVCPLIVISAALLMKDQLALSVIEMPTLIAVSATPGAVTGVTMAQELHCDDQLASQLVVWTSLFSVLSIFCFVYILRSIGML